MTLHEFNKVGEYISRKTNKDTSFYTSIGKIENDEFKYVWFFRNICCIRHKNDNQKRPIQYKTYNGAKKYIDKKIVKLDNGYIYNNMYYEDFDEIKDLIKADLVEKVDDKQCTL